MKGNIGVYSPFLHVVLAKVPTRYETITKSPSYMTMFVSDSSCSAFGFNLILFFFFAYLHSFFKCLSFLQLGHGLSFQQSLDFLRDFPQQLIFFLVLVLPGLVLSMLQTYVINASDFEVEELLISSPFSISYPKRVLVTDANRILLPGMELLWYNINVSQLLSRSHDHQSLYFTIKCDLCILSLDEYFVKQIQMYGNGLPSVYLESNILLIRCTY